MHSNVSVRWIAGLLVALCACSEDPGGGSDVATQDVATTVDRPPGLDVQNGDTVVYEPLDVMDTGSPTPDATPDVPVGVDVRPDVARPADAGFTGGPSACTGSTYTICEDFESGSFNAAVWTAHATNGTQVVDAMHVARGSHALHIHTATMSGGGGANVGLTSTHGFPPASDTYWGRAFVYMAAATAPTTHTTLFESNGSTTVMGTAVTASQRFSISGGKLDASYDTSPRPPTTDYAHRSATNMPLNRWACLEWEFKGDTHEVHYFLDDVELTDMAQSATATPVWPAPMWTHVQVGLQLYQPDVVNTFDMWLDEIAINATRIRCEN